MDLPPIPPKLTPEEIKEFENLPYAKANPDFPFQVLYGLNSDIAQRIAFKVVGKSPLQLQYVIRSFLGGGPVTSSTDFRGIYYILGRFRGLLYDIETYNSAIALQEKSKKHPEKPVKPEIIQYKKRRALVTDPTEKVKIVGLKELIKFLEDYHKEDIDNYKDLIKGKTIVYDGLAELYKPGTEVVSVSGIGGSFIASFVTESYYEERKTLFGLQTSFHLGLSFVASVGEKFCLVKWEEVISGWMGVRSRDFNDLQFVPITDEIKKNLSERGHKYNAFGAGTPKFLSYQKGSFYPHRIHNGKPSKTDLSGSNSGGRLIVDIAKGNELGHNAARGYDQASLFYQKDITTYSQWKRELSFKGKSVDNDTENGPPGMQVFHKIPKDLKWCSWPAIVGFSFTLKLWGHALIEGIDQIKFDDKAFDQLVLPADRKMLIKALVSYSGDTFSDIIDGKGGGSVFLLHGPPGVGKTLTAEAIAEMLHRPLYNVSMGELGITPDDMESRLGDILNLCSGWEISPLVLIDEADVFLEKRTKSDILRNAMVCIVLKLLEYHKGVLFLTTNRVEEFDPAFESRVTVALKYENLDKNAREQVWKNLIEASGVSKGKIDTSKLAKSTLNGRQIKNCVVLALALCKEEGSKQLEQVHLDTCLKISTLGRHDMKTAVKF